MRELYESLLQGLAHALQVPASELLLGGQITLDAVEFQLLLHESQTEDVLVLICRFGPLAPEGEGQAMRRLLQTNLQLADGELSSFFAMDAKGIDLLLCVRILLLDTSVTDLLSCMRVCCAEVRSWRQQTPVNRATPGQRPL